MIDCPSCGKENQDHYKFCLGCGAKLPAPQAAAPQQPGAQPAPAQQPPAPQAPVQNFGTAGTGEHPNMRSAQPPGAAAPGAPQPVQHQPSYAPQPGYAPQANAVTSPPLTSGGVVPGGSMPPGAAPPGAPTGAAGDQAIACPSCGTSNPPGFAFCGRCGHKFGPGGAGAAAPQSPSSGAPAPGAPATNAPGAPASPGGAAPAPGDVGSARTMFMDASSLPPHMQAGGAPQAFKGRLVLLREDGSEGGVLALEGGPENLGRNYGPPFDQDAYLDPDHTGVVCHATGLEFRDLGSSNGVFVRIQGRVELQDRDVFRVGQELMLYEDLPEPESATDGTERMGSPNPGYWGRLSVLVEPSRASAAYPIADEGISIGRENGDVTFPEDGYVSGSHCRVVGDDAGVWLEDLNSSNGTYMRVRDGQVIPFGSLVLLGQNLFRIDQE